jgi:hypothetical protein
MNPDLVARLQVGNGCDGQRPVSPRHPHIDPRSGQVEWGRAGPLGTQTCPSGQEQTGYEPGAQAVLKEQIISKADHGRAH